MYYDTSNCDTGSIKAIRGESSAEWSIADVEGTCSKGAFKYTLLHIFFHFRKFIQVPLHARYYLRDKLSLNSHLFHPRNTYSTLFSCIHVFFSILNRNLTLKLTLLFLIKSFHHPLSVHTYQRATVGRGVFYCLFKLSFLYCKSLQIRTTQ